MNVLITGGTGLVGKALTQLLLKNRHDVAVLSRNPPKNEIKSFAYDVTNNYIDPESIEFADVIINLAGENIAGRKWTQRQKKLILDSRIQTVELLADQIAKAKNKPVKLISASAIGYYGSVTSDKIYQEDDEPGSDFLARTVESWEKSVDSCISLGLQVCKVRIGVVLAKEGGALPKMITPVKYGLAAGIGSGKQWMPWVSLEDLSNLILFVMEHKLKFDVFNAVAPEHINNLAFMRTLAEQFGRPSFLPNIPSSVLKLMMGEMATVVLEGSRISSERIVREGFNFKHKTLREALDSIYQKK